MNATNHGMQRSGGGAFFGEIDVDSRHPLIPTVTRSINVRISPS